MPSSSRYSPQYSTSAPSELPAAPEVSTLRKDGADVWWIKGADARPGRYLEGVGSTPTPNSHGYALSSKGCDVRLPFPLLHAHGRDKSGATAQGKNLAGFAIGQVIQVTRTDEFIHVVARLDEGIAADHAWRLIQSGENRCFSLAAARGAKLQGIVDAVSYFEHWTPSELSVCRQGANPDAKILRFWEQ